MAEDIPVRQFSNQRYNYCANICKSVTRNGVQPSIRANSFPELNMWAVTVRVELAQLSQRKIGLWEINFSHACGYKSEDACLEKSSIHCAGCCGKDWSVLWQTWMVSPCSSKEQQSCSAAQKKLQYPGREQAQEITQPRVTWLTYIQHAWHPSPFCPWWGVFVVS